MASLLKGKGRRGRSRFSSDDERNAEAAPPLAISWTSNMPSFALMRVWGQCQAGRGILHPLIFKARALSRAAHGSTGLLPDIQCVAHTAAFTLKCRHDARYRSLPVFTFWLRARLYLCVSGRWKLPPRLWEGTLMFTQTTTLGSSAMSSKTQALFVTSNLSRTTSSSTLVCCLLACKEKPGPSFSGLRDKSSSLLESDCCALFAQVSAMFIVVAEQIAQWFVGPLWLPCRGCQMLKFFAADTSLSSRQREGKTAATDNREWRRVCSDLNRSTFFALNFR